MKPRYRLLLTVLFCLPTAAWAAPLTVAVATNFAPTLEKIADLYSRETDREIRISTASTGTIYAQILNGAPWDLFLAADVARPFELEQRGLTRGRFTYAIGQLVLWAPDAAHPVNEVWLKGLTGRLAIANPDLAPYGSAAVQVLARFDARPGQLVQGSNVAQAFQFVHSGNVDAGLVALSQIRSLDAAPDSSDYWIVPACSHDPIEQQLVVLRSAPATADDFATFLRSPAVRGIIEADGYHLAMP